MDDGRADRTPTEQEIINKIASLRGETWAEENAELILAQVRLVGDI